VVLGYPVGVGDRVGRDRVGVGDDVVGVGVTVGEGVVGVGVVTEGVGLGRREAGVVDTDVDGVGVALAVVVGAGGGVEASWPPPICWTDAMGRAGLPDR
jgi:hypothetical protein